MPTPEVSSAKDDSAAPEQVVANPVADPPDRNGFTTIPETVGSSLDSLEQAPEKTEAQPPINLFQRPSKTPSAGGDQAPEVASSELAPVTESSQTEAAQSANPERIARPQSPASPTIDSQIPAPPLSDPARRTEPATSTPDSPASVAAPGTPPAARATTQPSAQGALNVPPQSWTQPVRSTPVTPAPAPAREQEAPEEPKGLLDLYDSEELMCEVDSGDDGRFVLTSQRLIYQGRSSEGSLFSAAAVEDVTAIEFGRRARDTRSAWWGVVGLIAAIAVWQVTTNETVGAVAGAIVGGISLLLLADYWFRPAGLILRFGTSGGPVEGPVSSKRIRDAEILAAQVQQMKQPGQSAGQGSRTGNSGRPPGGSPGLG